MARALVTGGAGFIGSHLVDQLLTDGHQVTVVDNLGSSNTANLGEAMINPQFTFHQMDISDAKNIKPYFQGIDWVFHLASLADIVPSIQNPLKYYKANVDGTVAALEAARDAGVKRFIYAASSSCYGIPDQFPTPESAPARPMYPYALTKYLGEQCVMHWSQVYKIPCVSLRLFNVYGPRSRTSGTYGAVFGVFLAQKLAGKPFTVVGDGSQTRDFTYVSDVVDCFIKASVSQISGKIFNVGSGNTYSINNLVEILGGDVIHLPKRPGEPHCTFADIRSVTQELGWMPKVSFQEGVALMLENIDKWQGAPVWDTDSIADATKEWFEYLGPGLQSGTES